MPEHGLAADGKCFKCFEEEIAEIAVKVFADGVELRIAFFGEGIFEIGEDHFFAVADHMVEENKKYIGYEV
jgi:hypothetical protein